MANFDKDMLATHLRLEKFGGLDRQGPLCGGENSYELRNLRVMADGSLERRCGYAPVLTLQAPVRGVFCTARQGRRETYAVAGSGVYSIGRKGTALQALLIGQLDTDEGEVHFFCYDGSVLLLDGCELWTLRPDGAFRTSVYVPLYGNGWSSVPGEERAVHEPLNLLTRRIRVRFCMTELNNIYLAELAVASVDAVLIDGALSSAWSYQSEHNIIHLQGDFEEGEMVEVYMTLPQEESEQRRRVTCAARADVLGGSQDTHVLFYGGGVAIGRAWMTRQVDAAGRACVRSVCPDSCMLYVTQEDLLVIGDGVCAINGCCRHYDRSLIFTEGATWMADGTQNESGTLRLLPVNTALGSTSLGACCAVGNSPLTVCGQRVLRWNSQTDERNECNAYVISAPVGSLLWGDFSATARACALHSLGEVWLYAPGKRQRILVWQEASERWTSLDGFVAQGVFELGDQVGFFADRTLFLLDGQATQDTDAQGNVHPIEAEYRSPYLDFGHAGRTKRMCGVTVIAHVEDAPVEVILQNVKGRERVVSLCGRSGEDVSVMPYRGGVGRFRYLRAGVRCRGEGAFRLYGIQLCAQG